MRVLGMLLLGVLIPQSAKAQALWSVDTATSAVRFRVQHMLIHHVQGQFQQFWGRVMATDTSLSDPRIEASVEITSINTRREARDESLRGPDFFHADRFPTMSFLSTDVTPSANGWYRMVGNLTLRGVTRVVRFDVQPVEDARLSSGWRRFRATSTIDRFAFGLNYRGNDFLAALSRSVPVVGDEVEIELDIVLRPVDDVMAAAGRGGH